MEIILFSLELCGGIDLGGTDLLDGHLDVVHPLDHLGIPGVVHLPDKGVVLLPERHLGRFWDLLMTSDNCKVEGKSQHSTTLLSPVLHLLLTCLPCLISLISGLIKK